MHTRITKLGSNWVTFTILLKPPSLYFIQGGDKVHHSYYVKKQERIDFHYLLSILGKTLNFLWFSFLEV